MHAAVIALGLCINARLRALYDTIFDVVMDGTLYKLRRQIYRKRSKIYFARKCCFKRNNVWAYIQVWINRNVLRADSDRTKKHNYECTQCGPQNNFFVVMT